MGAKKLNTHEKSEIVLLHELGFNQTKIASRLGKNQKSLSEGVGGNHPWLPDKAIWINATAHGGSH